MVFTRRKKKEEYVGVYSHSPAVKGILNPTPWVIRSGGFLSAAGPDCRAGAGGGIPGSIGKISGRGFYSSEAGK